MQWLQHPNQNNLVNLNNVKRETIRHFRKNKNVYQKAKIDELETNSKKNNIKDLYRDISNFKKVYQLRTNAVKHEKRDLAKEFWLGGGNIPISC
jgi:hypothetical protein